MCTCSVHSDGFETHRYENCQTKNAIQKCVTALSITMGLKPIAIRMNKQKTQFKNV